MKSYNKYSAAAWLLNEAMDPADPLNEDEELDIDTEEEDSEEESDDDFDLDSEDEDEESDEDEDDINLEDIEISDEDEEDGEIDADLEARVKALEDKIDTMDIAKGDDDEVFDLDISNPVCPCCGSRLNIVNDAETDDSVDIDGDEEDASIVDLSSLNGPAEDDETEEGAGEAIQVADDDFMVSNDYSSEAGGEWSKLEDLFNTGVDDNNADEDEDEDIEI